jgi:hypothetical protein
VLPFYTLQENSYLQTDFKISLWGNFPSVSYWRKNLPQNKQFRHNVYQKYLKIKKKTYWRKLLPGTSRTKIQIQWPKLIGGIFCQDSICQF